MARCCYKLFSWNTKLTSANGQLIQILFRGLDLSLDPDIVAAMDDDFDFEDPDNMLDDDFIMKAMDDVLDGGEIDSDEDGEDGDWETESGEDSSECMGGRSEDEDFDEVRIISDEIELWHFAFVFKWKYNEILILRN